jgi:hypothetical protein
MASELGLAAHGTGKFTAAACANATRPDKGRCVLMTRCDFIGAALVRKWRWMQAMVRTVKSLYRFVKPCDNDGQSRCIDHTFSCPTPPSPDDKMRWRCSRTTPKKRLPPVLHPRDSRDHSPQYCKSRRACGARSSRRDRSAISSRGRSKRCVARRPDGWMNRGLIAARHRPRRRLSNWR